jgi:phosphate transport system substrate-binding protein
MRSLSLAVLLAISSCRPPDAGKLVLTGASTVAPLAGEIGKRFESLHPGVRVDVQTGGSGRGIHDARQGLSDIGLVSRPLKDDEKDLIAFPIARDGVCVILHKSNPVSALTDAQVVAIYTGRTTTWKEVGGKDAAITVVNKAEGRSTLELFCRYYQLKSADIKAHVIIGDNAQGIKTVAGNVDSIGYVSIGTAEYEAGQGTAIRLLPAGGVAATIENVGNGTFPLSRPLHLVVKKTPEGLAKDYIEFARSAKVHDLVRGQYFVPIVAR